MVEGLGAAARTDLVMVPGLGLQRAAWEPTSEALRRSRPDATARAVLLPGYGLRWDGKVGLSPAELGAQLAMRLPAGSRVVLCGHSASCQVVAHAARTTAALGTVEVTGLVLVGPTTDPRARSWPALLRRWLATARHETPRQLPTLVRQYWRTGVSGMFRGMDAARRDSLELALAGVRCPVLLVRGAEDRIAPGDWLAELVSGGQRRGDDVRRVDLAAGGHMVPLTHGPLVAEAVSTFLESVAKA